VWIFGYALIFTIAITIGMTRWLARTVFVSRETAQREQRLDAALEVRRQRTEARESLQRQRRIEAATHRRREQEREVAAAAALEELIRRENRCLKNINRWKMQSVSGYKSPLDPAKNTGPMPDPDLWAYGTVKYRGQIIKRLQSAQVVHSIKSIRGAGGGWGATIPEGLLLPTDAGFAGEVPVGVVLCEVVVCLYPGILPHPYACNSHLLNDAEGFSSHFRFADGKFEMMASWQAENERVAKDRVGAIFRGLDVSVITQLYRDTDMYCRIGLMFSESIQAISWSSFWPSQERLFHCIKRIFPDALFEYTASWLGQQRLDIFVPSRKLAIEYNGEQHYRPIARFGGLEKYLANIDRDQRKRELCSRHGIQLIEWPYTDKINDDAVRRRLAAEGVH
jgi:hypothetical protein